MTDTLFKKMLNQKPVTKTPLKEVKKSAWEKAIQIKKGIKNG